MAFIVPFIPAILSAVGAGVAAIGAIRQGKAAAAADAYNAAMARQNAAFSRQNADLQAAQDQRTTAMRLGAIRASQGASGGTQAGSALDVIGDVARQGEIQKQIDIYQGEQQAAGYEGTATLDTMRASSDLAAGQAGAIGAIGKGAMTAYSQWPSHGAGSSLLTRAA